MSLALYALVYTGSQMRVGMMMEHSLAELAASIRIADIVCLSFTDADLTPLNTASRTLTQLGHVTVRRSFIGQAREVKNQRRLGVRIGNAALYPCTFFSTI